MKVALIGNMNNNHFAILRYMRDLGIDAYLLLYTDELKHFFPEYDTWEIEKWRPYIKQTSLPNGNIRNYSLLRAKTVRKELGGYDIYIGNGFAPAYFYKAGMRLNAFAPYGVGIEFIWHGRKKKDLSSLSSIKTGFIELFYKYFQLKGIEKNTDYGFAAEAECMDCLSQLDINLEKLYIPMVYNREVVDREKVSTEIKSFATKMQEYDLVAFSHTSHVYKDVPPHRDYKRNYILIEGFAAFIKEKKVKKPLLVLLNYGIDVPHSKQMIKDLGIEEHVLWLPQMSRKEIMYLLDFVDIGAGEFGGTLWGGTGWEFLSKGIPFLQYVNLSPSEYEAEFDQPYPDFFNVSTPKQVKEVFLEFELDKVGLKAKGKRCKDWFEKYNGIKLVEKYIEVLQIKK